MKKRKHRWRLMTKITKRTHFTTARRREPPDGLRA
jgi:hypothetical protein